jgi:hypothetical protein
MIRPTGGATVTSAAGFATAAASSATAAPNENPASHSASQPVRTRPGAGCKCVVELARAGIVLPGAAADAAEIEAQRGRASLLHRARQRVHDLVLHRPAIQRVRMAHDAAHRRNGPGRRILDAGLERARRSVEDYRTWQRRTEARLHASPPWQSGSAVCQNRPCIHPTTGDGRATDVLELRSRAAHSRRVRLRRRRTRSQHLRLGANRNPHLRWSGVPVGNPLARAPVRGHRRADTRRRRQQPGRVVPASLPRTDFTTG